MYYLDINTPMINFQEYRNSLYVDKTLMIDKIQKRISTLNKYICITRPRRFGKTMNANMLAAYFAKGYDSRELFKGLKISKVPEFEEHMNQHHVIYIDLSRLPDPCTSFQEYLNWIKYCLLDDLKKAYHIEKVPGEPMQNLFERTNDKFIFILDEWDSIFYKTFINDNDKKAYLEFLKGLLKDQPYVELAYMTGVLPILQYSKGSELNMFREYNFMNDMVFESYFGFTENEVRELCEHCKNVSYENLKYWYDGYHLSNGNSLFNPRSVNNALSDGVCQNYWTETGPMHEISNCIKHNVKAVREDIVKMVSNIPVRADLEGYAATQLQLDTRDEILSSMVVFGFLSYYNGFLTIPNHELMIKFQNVLKEEYMEGVSEIVRQSNEILKATIDGNADKVAEMIEIAHDKEIPFLQYNNENSMSCVITLCYLSARNDYDITREDKSGKGYVDFLFTPKISGYPAIILELKYDKSAEEAIKQIKDKNYIEKINNIEECLFVGINYAKKDKKHTCLIEKITHKI